MEILVQKKFDDEINTLKETSFPHASINNLFKSSPNYTALLTTNNTTSKSVKLETRERSFKSQEVNYLHTIYFYTDNLPNAKQAILFNYTNSRGVKTNLAISATDSFAFVLVKDFTHSFDISYSGKGIRPKIKKIQINGLESKKLESSKFIIAEFISSHISLENIVNRLKLEHLAGEHKVASIREDIKAQEDIKTKNEEKIIELSLQVHSHEAELKQYQTEISEAENRLFSISNDEAAKQNSFSQLVEQESSLNRKIIELRSTLEGLQRDRDIISDEFVDYVKEGKGQTRSYLGAIVLAFFVIGLCVALLFNGASNLLTTSFPSAEDVFAAFALRLPFAAVLSGVIVGAGAFIKYLIGRTVRINEERLVLAKLLVIAKDIIHSASDKIQLTDQEKLDSRIRLKIDLLKAHLTAELGENPTTSFQPQSQKTDHQPLAKEEEKQEPWI